MFRFRATGIGRSTSSRRARRRSFGTLITAEESASANDLKISIVAVGTSDAPVAFQSDSQMSSRFTLFEIPRWTESDDFRRLLRAFEQALPLRRPSDLVQRPIVQFLISASGGLLGEVSRLLTHAAEQSIEDHSERISLQHLEQAAYENA